MSTRPLFRDEMAHIDRFVSAAGVDLARDVEAAWIATDGRAGGESVALLWGRLNRDAVTARLQGEGGARLELGSADAYALTRKAGAGSAGPAETVVAWARPGVAAVGTRSWVQLALERAAGREAGIASGPMSRHLTRFDPRATLWSAAGDRALAAKLRSEFQSGGIDAEDLQVVRSLVASFWIADDVRFDSEAAAANGDDAELLALTLRGMIAIGGLQTTASDPEIAAVLRGLRVDRTAGGVRITGRIPASVASGL